MIWKLDLTPDVRGRSLGVRLMGHAIAALPDGTREVTLEHFAGNTRAAAFYAREGIEVTHTEPSPSGDPNAVVVWRRRPLSAT